MSDVLEKGIFGAGREAGEEASSLQVNQANLALEEQRRQFDLIQDNLAPFREIGNQAYQQQLANQIQGAPLTVDPGAEFRNQFQTRELNRNLAARGQLGGGNRLRALQAQAINTALQNEGQQFERLGALSGRGTGATSELSQAGSQFAGTIGQTMQDAANAQASGLIGAQNANQQTASGLASAAGTALAFFSDEELKQNIEVIENPLEKLDAISGVTWTWRENDEDGAGVIAQEIEEIIPEAITHENGYKKVNYAAVIGLLVESVKDLKAQVEANNA